MILIGSIFEVNGCTFKGGNCVIFIFASLLGGGLLLWGGGGSLLPQEQILSFICWPPSWKGFVGRRGKHEVAKYVLTKRVRGVWVASCWRRCDVITLHRRQYDVFRRRVPVGLCKKKKWLKKHGGVHFRLRWRVSCTWMCPKLQWLADLRARTEHSRIE